MTQVAEKEKNVVAISAPRLLYNPALKDLGVDQAIWRVLCESIFPNARSIEGIALAVRYCKARNLDIMKRPIHIVPMWSKSAGKEIETVWPGITEYRTTASRTQGYGGCEPTECGPMVNETFSNGVELSFHEWMRVTVYRIVSGTRCPFPGPKVYFKEIYSRIKRDVESPNDRWQKSPMGMHEKCAEAAALRKAFPEEMPADATAEEMEGKVIDIDVAPKELADNHMAEVSQLIDQKPNEAKPIDIASNADWYNQIDNEIVPGLQNCKTKKEISEFVSENDGLIKTIGDKAPAEVKDYLDGHFAKQLQKVGSK